MQWFFYLFTWPPWFWLELSETETKILFVHECKGNLWKQLLNIKGMYGWFFFWISHPSGSSLVWLVQNNEKGWMGGLFFWQFLVDFRPNHEFWALWPRSRADKIFKGNSSGAGTFSDWPSWPVKAHPIHSSSPGCAKWWPRGMTRLCNGGGTIGGVAPEGRWANGSQGLAIGGKAAKGRQKGGLADWSWICANGWRMGEEWWVRSALFWTIGTPWKLASALTARQREEWMAVPLDSKFLDGCVEKAKNLANTFTGFVPLLPTPFISQTAVWQPTNSAWINHSPRGPTKVKCEGNAWNGAVHIWISLNSRNKSSVFGQLLCLFILKRACRVDCF